MQGETLHSLLENKAWITQALFFFLHLPEISDHTELRVGGAAGNDIQRRHIFELQGTVRAGS